ncbi:HOOK3_1 [Blepharisma stoltei]|uniref:Calponin-homology (CH) domain-containing protein n=1 Tax=Blepharisma stoltei TaxID=1481888 RepID=A0AAU9IL39_9CILI|nr:unnamed protein product [Blepharisma stoltei]
MDDQVSDSLVQWLNLLNLSKKCERLSDFSDGILLYELMSKVSPDYFDLECITLDAHNNWALKLANLRRLKKAIELYLDQELHIQNEKIESIELANIARTADFIDMINLMEVIVFAIINCPMKETFIHPIMQLEEKHQIILMLFIKKAIGEDFGGFSPSNCSNKDKEIAQLRDDKRKMAHRIQEMQERILELTDQNTKIITERDELLMKNTEFETEIYRRKSPSGTCSPEYFTIEFDQKISEKDEKLMVMQQKINEVIREYEKKNSVLRDELDMAHSSVCKMKELEKLLDQYKIKFEKYNTLQGENTEIKRQNHILNDKVYKLEKEVEEINSIRKSMMHYKEQLEHEKARNGSLNFALENKEKQLKQVIKHAQESLDKLQFSEIRIQELEYEKKLECSSVVSDESFSSINRVPSEYYFEEPNKVEHQRKESKRFSISAPTADYYEVFNKHLSDLQEKCEKLKEKCISFEESFLMLNEEHSLKMFFANDNIKTLTAQNEELTEQINVLNAISSQNIKFKVEKLQNELDSLKENKEHLLQEITRLHEEKELSYKKYIECREETIVMQNIIKDKEIKIRELSLNEKLSIAKVSEYEDRAKITNEEIQLLTKQSQLENQDCQVKCTELEKETIALKSEKNALTLKLIDKDERIKEILKDKADTIKIIENRHRDTLDRIKSENNTKITQMITQTEEALNELQREREELAAKLKSERKSIGETKPSPEKVNSDEVKQLKVELEIKEKEIRDLIKANKELKKCWKESARLLKAVYKELGVETQKLENAAKKRY